LLLQNKGKKRPIFNPSKISNKIFREDDQTKEDMYDVQKNDSKEEKVVKWVPRFRLKESILRGDELMLKKLDAIWTEQIRRQFEADLRKKKRLRQIKLEEELEKIKAKLMAISDISDSAEVTATKKEENKVTEIPHDDSEEHHDDATNASGKKLISQRRREALSAVQLLARARVRRAKEEALAVVVEKERADAKRRAEAVALYIENKKKESDTGLSRSDVLSLQRAIDMKILMEDKIKERHETMKALEKRTTERKMQIDLTEALLRRQESNMTTPR
jgi:hypothetical protein